MKTKNSVFLFQGIAANRIRLHGIRCTRSDHALRQSPDRLSNGRQKCCPKMWYLRARDCVAPRQWPQFSPRQCHASRFPEVCTRTASYSRPHAFMLWTPSTRQCQYENEVTPEAEHCSSSDRSETPRQADARDDWPAAVGDRRLYQEMSDRRDADPGRSAETGSVTGRCPTSGWPARTRPLRVG